jgi:hypothetical protein
MCLRSGVSQSLSRDCVIEDLTLSEYEAASMAAQCWFESPYFATLYAAATHALIVRSETGETVSGFYRIDRYLKCFRKVQFVAAVDMADEVLHEVMRRRGAQFVGIPLIGRDFLDGKIHRSRQHNWRIARQAEDIVIELPASVEEYLASLGRQTRKHLPYYVRRLEREWGSQLRVAHLAGEGIKLDDFQRLVELNRARMRGKWKRSGWTGEMVRNRWRLACRTGVLTGIYRDDQLMAGTVCYLHRSDAFLALIAHDPAYDSLNLGTVALHKTIEQAIAGRYRAFHLLWGRGFYKRQFGGEEHPLFEAVVFRARYMARVWHTARTVREILQHLKQTITPIARMSRRLLLDAGQH